VTGTSPTEVLSDGSVQWWTVQSIVKLWTID